MRGVPGRADRGHHRHRDGRPHHHSHHCHLKRQKFVFISVFKCMILQNEKFLCITFFCQYHCKRIYLSSIRAELKSHLLLSTMSIFYIFPSGFRFSSNELYLLTFQRYNDPMISLARIPIVVILFTIKYLSTTETYSISSIANGKFEHFTTTQEKAINSFSILGFFVCFLIPLVKLELNYKVSFKTVEQILRL